MPTRVKITLACLIPILMAVLLVGFFVLLENTENLYGYVDNTGRFVIPPKYYFVSPFKNGRASVYILHRNTSGCDRAYNDVIDRQGKSTGAGDGYTQNCNGDHIDFEGHVPMYMYGSEQYPATAHELIDGGTTFGYKNKDGKWVVSP